MISHYLQAPSHNFGLMLAIVVSISCRRTNAGHSRTFTLATGSVIYCRQPPVIHSILMSLLRSSMKC